MRRAARPSAARSGTGARALSWRAGPQTFVGPVRRAAALRIAATLGPERGRTAALDARLLVAHAIDMDPERVPLHDGRALSAAQAAAIETAVARRVAGEPVARILGRREFWSLDFEITRAVLVPRPDSETLVAAALGAAPREADVSVLDIGTGSGAILIALLTELPRAWGVGTDSSVAALSVAARNAARLGVAGRCRFVAANWADCVSGGFNLIVANPPYIPTGTIGDLAPEVRDHDPPAALDGGPDGLDGHRAALDAIGRLLSPGGHAFVEIGVDQSAAFRALAERKRLTVRFHPDVAGIDRVAEIAR